MRRSASPLTTVLINPSFPTRCSRKTGYGNYGPADAKGARIIRLQQGESAALSATWIRTEDGKLLDQDSLLTLPEVKQAQATCSASEQRGAQSGTGAMHA